MESRWSRSPCPCSSLPPWPEGRRRTCGSPRTPARPGTPPAGPGGARRLRGPCPRRPGRARPGDRRRRASASRRCRPSSARRTSASRNTNTSPAAAPAPVQQAQFLPTQPAGFAGAATTRAPSRRASAAVPSVLPSSTTRISSARRVCRPSDCSSGPRRRSSFSAGMITDTRRRCGRALPRGRARFGRPAARQSPEAERPRQQQRGRVGDHGDPRGGHSRSRSTASGAQTRPGLKRCPAHRVPAAP